MSNLPFTLEQLRTFNTICEEGSFRQAAKKLYISQPAVSLQIQNMERQLNTTLFFRTKQKANLTKSGELFQIYCSKILMLCTETCQAIEELNKSESSALIIGASEPTGTYLLPRLLGIFRHKYPNIELQLTIGSADQIPWDVANQKIDLAIIGDDMPDELKPSLEITPYAEDEIALILPISHPFASLTSIRKEDLYRLRFIALKNQSATIQRSIENTLTQYGIDSSYFKFDMELNSIEAAKNAVQSGLGAAFVSVSALSKELELEVLHWAKIEGISLKRTLNIITHPNNTKAKKIILLKDKLFKMF